MVVFALEIVKVILHIVVIILCIKMIVLGFQILRRTKDKS